MVEAEVTSAILNDKRVDGRALDEIRGLSADTGILPRNHGVGLFSRGETQVLSIVTLGAPGLEQSLEVWRDKVKTIYAPLQLPPYSVELAPTRNWSSRNRSWSFSRKSPLPVLPKEDFLIQLE